jgi:ABC-type ATPase involved in cell division
MPEDATGKTAEALFSDSASCAPVLSLKRLRLTDESGFNYGPVDLELRSYEKALLKVDSPTVIKDLVKVIIGMKRPVQGEVYFQSKKMDRHLNILERSGLYRQIGLITRSFGLIAGLSVSDNLLTFLLYHSKLDKPLLKERILRIQNLLGFGDKLGRTPFSSLSDNHKALGAVALCLAKQPPLIVMERPGYLLGRLFSSAWEQIDKLNSLTGASILVLALPSEDYGGFKFDRTLEF